MWWSRVEQRRRAVPGVAERSMVISVLRPGMSIQPVGDDNYSPGGVVVYIYRPCNYCHMSGLIYVTLRGPVSLTVSVPSAPRWIRRTPLRSARDGGFGERIVALSDERSWVVGDSLPHGRNEPSNIRALTPCGEGHSPASTLHLMRRPSDGSGLKSSSVWVLRPARRIPSRR